MAKKNYSDQLKDPRWQKKRLDIMNRDGFTCQLCGDKGTMLNIHHKQYTAKNVWDEPNENLVTICKHCHAIIHSEDSINFSNKKIYYDDNVEIYKNVRYIIDNDIIFYDIILSYIDHIKIIILEDSCDGIFITNVTVMYSESFDNIRKSLRL